MNKIETVEQALQWCHVHAATVKFLDGCHVYVLGELVGDGETFVKAVDTAELTMYADDMRSQALNELDEEEGE
jgi:endonuclease IV